MSRVVMGSAPSGWTQMSAEEFGTYYWRMFDLTALAKRLGLSARGPKPALGARISRRLAGLPERAERAARMPRSDRDSDRPLTLDRRVVNFKSDRKTRAFFRSEIGPHFHFTYHLNQYRLAQTRVTYRDLVNEWRAEYERRKNPHYRAPLASHGEYNRFIREFFADVGNRGKSLKQAAAAWNAAKRRRNEGRDKGRRGRTR